MVKPGAEELRQKVFSSTHMSTMVKSTQATITYPCCSYCGGYLNSSPKRKAVLGQLSLYTNTSESFIVWYKKHDEPKGMLWLRSHSIKKGHEATEVQLITRGCREKCSYTLTFLARAIADEWYRFLRQESRRAPSIGSGIFVEDIDSASSLDSILNDVNVPSHGANASYLSDSDENWSDETEWHFGYSAATRRERRLSVTASVGAVPLKRNSESRMFQGPRSISPILTSFAPVPEHALDELLITGDINEDQLSRWSWPLRT